MIKVLFIGDQHFKTDNIPEVELFIQKITQLAEDKKPDIILVAGDLLDTHERIHTTPLNKAYEFIDKMRKIALTYVLVGNHDMLNNGQFLTDNHWLNGMKEWDNTIIVDKVICKKFGDILFTFVPYVSPGRFEEALNSNSNSDLDWKNSNCIFAHQEFYGCKMGAIVSIEGDKWDLNYPNVISGHIHSKQRPQKNIYYPGSAMQHAFGESTKNIIAYLTFTEKERQSEGQSAYELEEIDLELPRKKIVYMDVDKFDEYKVPDKENNDKIKLTVSGSFEEFKALKKTKKYKDIMDKGIKLVFKADKIKKAENVPEKIENETVFSTILNELVNEKKDNYLLEIYELVVNNKKIDKTDFMYIN